MKVLAAGTEIGNEYVIEAPISTGGMGAVYRARRISDGALVAVKQPLEERNALRFQIEARLLARLRHPRVVRVLDHVASEEHGGVLVMELVRGPTLASVLSRAGPAAGRRRPSSTRRQACEALAYIHAQQIVHRDVKPANLILADDGIVLVDFGIARDARSGNRPPTGALGTPRFAAPEVLAGGAASPRSDVYGLARDVVGVDRGRAARSSWSAARWPRGCPGSRAIWIRRLAAALEPDPHLRLQSAEAFARALGEGVRADRGASLSLVGRAAVRRARGLGDDRALRRGRVRRRRSLDRVPGSGDLVYEAAWGAGAEEIVGVRLGPGGGIAAHVAASGRAEAIPSCRDDFALRPLPGREHRLRAEHDARPPAGPGRPAVRRAPDPRPARRRAVRDHRPRPRRRASPTSR